jgi:hypothetical protein
MGAPETGFGKFGLSCAKDGTTKAIDKLVAMNSFNVDSARPEETQIWITAVAAVWPSVP